MTETRAAVFREPEAPASIEPVVLAAPGPGEVLVRLAAAGVCHSDLHCADGHLSGNRFPVVLGHEGAGVVEQVGAGVPDLSPGTRVALCFLPACGACRRCREGRSNLCETNSRATFAGTALDGHLRIAARDGVELKSFLGIACFAEHCVVPAASAVPIPDGLALWQASLIGCAVVTGFGAVRNAAGVAPGESVCVVGCGGVGLQVVAAARLAGAGPIVAVDRVAEKLALAEARGATHGVDASEPDAARAVRRLTAGGVDHAFEVVGRAETIRLAWDTLRPGATATVVGLAPVGVDASVPAVDFLSEKSLRGSFYGSGNPAAEISRLAELAADGDLEIADVVSHFTDLDGIDEAFARLRRGEGARTIVVLDRDLAGAPAS